MISMVGIKEILMKEGGSAQKRVDSGIDTTEKLLEVAATKKGRRDLAKNTRIPQSLLLRWANLADLLRVKGIGKKYMNLLKEAEVVSISEQSIKDPEELHAKIIETNENKRLVKMDPRLSDVQSWIEQSKQLPVVVEQ
jgi:predicted flap endonuclease-1-like 5' DNA nuclease